VEKPKGPRRWALAMLKAGAGNIGINCGILCASLFFFVNRILCASVISYWHWQLSFGSDINK
jgi:hypothetical protein